MSNHLKSFALASLVFSLTCGVGLAASDVVVKHTLAQTATSSDTKADADKLFQEGVQQFRRGEYPKALQTYQRVLEIRRKLGDKAGIGQTLNNIGQVYNGLQQNDKALEILQQALIIRREIKDRAGEGETLDILGAVYLILEKDEKSLETLQQALAIRREVKDRNGEAATLSKIGFTYVFLKKQEQGLKLLQEALALHQELKDKFQEGFTLFRIAQVYWNADDYTRALEWYNKSLTVNREVGNRAFEGRSLQQIGLMHFKLEKYEQAIQYYQQALPLIREAGISPAEESIIASIGDGFNNLKQYDQNITFYQRELANARKSNNKSLQGNILKWIGTTYFKQENYDRALEFLRQALPFVAEVKDKDFKANVIAAIGDCFFRKKQYQQAIDFYQQAIVAAREGEDIGHEGRILNVIGNVHSQKQQYDSALKFYQQALSLARKAKNESLEIQILTDIGDTYNTQKQYDRAIAFYQQELQTARKADNKLLQGNILLFIGSVYFIKDDQTRALEFSQQAFNIFKAVNAQDRQLRALILTMRSHYSIAFSAQKKKDYTLAMNEANKIITLAPEALTIARNLKQKSKENEVGEIQSRAYTLIGSIHENLGDLKKAQEFAEQGLKIAQQSENLEAEDFALSVIALIYDSLGNQSKKIELNQRQLEIAQKLKNPISEVQALLNIAGSYQILGNYQKTLELEEQALTKIEAVDIKKLPEEQQVNAWTTKSLVFWNFSLTYLSLGEYDKALKFAQKCIDLVQTLKKPELDAAALLRLGNVYAARQEFEQAIKLTQKALDIAKQIKNPEIETNALKQLGKIYVARGNYSQATELANLLSETADKNKNINLKLDALNILKDVYTAQGNLQKVLELLEQSLTIAKQDKNPSSEFWALFNQATFYMSPLGNYQKTLDLSQQANSTAKKLQNPQMEAMSLFLLASAHFIQGEPQKTIELTNQGLAISQNRKMIWLEMLANVLLTLGYGDLNNDQKAMESAQAVLALTKKAQSPKDEKTALTLLGHIHRKFGRKQEAINTYKQALAIQVSAKVVGADSDIYAGLGRAYTDLNQPEEAIKNFREAFTRAEEVRRGFQGLTPDLQASFWKQIADFDRVKTADIYRQYADLLLKQGRTAEAQQILDLINVRDLRDARNQAKNNSLIALGFKIQECEDKKCSPSQKSQLLDQVEAINTQYDRDLEVIEKEISSKTSLDRGAFDPIYKSKAKEIVEAQPGTVMISPFVLEDKMWLLLTAPGGVNKAFEVKVSRKELGQAVKDFRDLMEYCEQPGVVCTDADIPKIQLASQKLYNLLIKPLEPELKENPVKHLVFALDRVTRYIPMSALYDGKQYLIEKYSVHNILSSTLTDIQKPNLQANKDTQVLAMGVSEAVGKFSRLPNVKQEIETVVKIYPGLHFLNKQFDFLTLRNNVSGKHILHLATHGEFVSNKQAKTYESYILLGTGDYLTIPLIKKLPDLGKVHLVVLSACRSALADSLGQDGIEINSTAHEFMIRGAKAVLASLWVVADKSTSQIMQEFYKNLATGKMTKSEALRQAQLSLLKGKKSQVGDDEKRAGALVPIAERENSSKNREATNYSHPYYWAPFILIGNGL
jgi:CHAT domain-containing protein/ATP/maltotriose-dependent transcriptional regulator MalT